MITEWVSQYLQSFYLITFSIAYVLPPFCKFLFINFQEKKIFLGGAVTTNVIFSTESYIPTYLTLNVTINVFGEVINVGQVSFQTK